MKRAVLIAVLVVSGSLPSMLCAAETPGEWSANSPGTLKIVEVPEKAPDGSKSRRIVFNPALRSGGGEYWCSAAVTFAQPSSANVVSFFAKTSAPRAVDFKLYDSEGRYGYFNAQVPDEWVRIQVQRESASRIGGGEGALKDIVRLEFVFNNTHFASEKQPYQLSVANVELKTKAPKKFLYPNWMPATTPPPVPGYRIGTCLHPVWGPGNGEFFGFDKPGGYEVAINVADYLLKHYGNVELTMAAWRLTGEKGRQFSDYFKSKGGIPMAEGHQGGSHIAEAINIHGQNGNEAGFTHGNHQQDLTDSRLIAYVQEGLVRNAEAGAMAYRNVDYIWQYWGGGVWGYSDAAIQAWRNALTETDGGILIVAGNTKGTATRTAYFWEYFQSYTGYRMKPSDVGIESWDQYLPPQANAKESPQLENTRTLHNLLFHYWWVKYCHDTTVPSAPLGLLSQPITNPEFFANGTDYYWLFKASLVRGASIEWWGGADVIVANYYNGRYYDNVAKKNGRELMLHGETAAAGGRPYPGDEYRPHYWDNQANYLITYAQSASVDFKGKHDQYWGSRWEKMTDPAHPEYQSFTGFHSAWCAFLQCRNDKAVKPKTDVLAITRRPIMQGDEPFDISSEARQAYNLQRELFELNYIHDGAAFPIEDAYNLADYKTIVQSNIQPPRVFVEKLAEWAAEGDGRTIVTHSFVPTRVAAPAPRYSEERLLQPGGNEKTLGLESIEQTDLRSGTVKSNHSAFAAALDDLDGSPAKFAEGLFKTRSAAAGKVLVWLDKQPLVSEWPLGGGRVVYLHFVPTGEGISARRLRAAIMDGVMRYLGHKPAGISETHRVLSFERPGGGQAFISLYWDATAQTLGSVGKVHNVFQAQDPEVRGQALLLTGQGNKQFKITDMITGQTTSATSDADGYLPLSLNGWNLRGVHVDAD